MDKTLQDTDLIQMILAGDRKFLEKLYMNWRSDFMSWVERNYFMNREEGSGLYQDTFLQFYMNIKERKVEEIQHPKTYLYGIAKNLIRQKFKQKNKIMSDLDVVDDIPFKPVDTDPSGHKEELQRVLHSFGEPCKSILLMFYFENFSHEVIASRLGYKNEPVVKKKKSLCMSELIMMWYTYMK